MSAGDERVTAVEGEPSPATSPLVIGQVIGRYRIDAILGIGGMGVVARARDLDLDRDVALKVATRSADGSAESGRDQRRAALLLREAQAMARLRMRNVRAVYDVGSASGVDYIAMEYIAGVDLARWLETPRSVDQIVRVFAAAGRGLAAAHDAGILHRDFKASNVLVGDDGEIVVTDFGIAKWLHEPDAPASAAGTPGYLPPEDRFEPRSDQYSFCIALSEAVTPIPARLAAVIDRGASAEPAARFADMVAVVAALEAALETPETAPATETQTGKRRWPIVLALGITAVGVVAIASWPSGHRVEPAGANIGALAFANQPLDRELDEVRALADRGYLRTARRRAEQTVRLAEGSSGRQGAAAYALGRVALLQDDISVARTKLDEAARLADAGRDDKLRARALLELYRIAVTRGSDAQATDRAEQAAVAAVSRVASAVRGEPSGPTSGDREDQATLVYLRGIVESTHGMDARPALRRARALVEPPDAHVLIAWCEIVRSLAALELEAGDREAALALGRELVAVADRIAGRDHMTAISGRGALATTLEAAGRYDEAERVMTELREAGRTEAGERLLAELADAPVDAGAISRLIQVTVRDPEGAPVAGALVVAATEFHSNARSLLAAASLYAERAHDTSTAITDAHGIAALRVVGARARQGMLWIAAEQASAGRSRSLRAGGADHVELALAPWGKLVGRAPRDAQVIVVPDGQADAPRIEVQPTPDGRFTVERIAQGRYLVAICVLRDASQRCAVQRAGVPGAVVSSIAITGASTLVIHPHDELARPIESSFVVIAPAGYTPRDLHALETGWITTLANQPDATIAWASVHGGVPARFAGLREGRYTVCASAVHGDTEDPSFTSRLDARQAAVPLFCEQVRVTSGLTDHALSIPASRRVWLGDPAP